MAIKHSHTELFQRTRTVLIVAGYDVITAESLAEYRCEVQAQSGRTLPVYLLRRAA